MIELRRCHTTHDGIYNIHINAFNRESEANDSKGKFKLFSMYIDIIRRKRIIMNEKFFAIKM